MSQDVPPAASGEAWPQRLDMAVAAVAGVSRRRAQRLIADGVVTLNGRVAKSGDKGRMIGPQDRVLVTAEVGRVLPQPEMPLVVLGEGDGWVAVDKPAGVPVHPLREGEAGTLLNAVAGRYPQVQGVGASGDEGGLKSGVVHRLDVETSGVLLFALDEERWQRFRQAFSNHTADKRYTAIVSGHPPEHGEVDLRLAVTQHKPARVQAVPDDPSHPHHSDSRRCTLSWNVTQRLAAASQLDIQLGTGFLHQIRATFAHLGHPVLGDPVYGPTSSPHETKASRMLLHATSLRIEGIEVESPLPEAFLDVGSQP
ncbi:RluA family pseudouridine synthase [Algisphaera agarilytica]|uniref:23S rRNA pseudouridine1911/1915/1917 synthase n=1 Tax=Algisphaera agarilytica TaxID=1385975 RepID=A0A7X0H951_9BACT|nr:RluA family pseudouridine synthase [Algisphaera agarilytica]MBB6431413.1 23S rRNA pseudouridine1911/1915/1917 synthase [Algisphaera agarilytica]